MAEQDRLRAGPKVPPLPDTLSLRPAAACWCAPWGVYRQLSSDSGVSVYLLSPRGGLLLHCTTEANAEGLLEDAERALGVSKIG